MRSTFGEFYRALYGREPFPWQARLAAQVTQTGDWPDEIGIPTGLGKTACLDLAVWWLALQAERAPARRTAPTRIWWVGDRPLLAEKASDRAEALSAALREPATEAVAAVADRLRSLPADPAGDPLEVIELSGIASPRPADPSQPAVILSSLSLYGSRLLFRGYGTTRSMRPVEAALAGTDSLVFLDETPRAAPLRGALVPALGECTPRAQAVLGTPRSRPRFVALTATGGTGGEGRFGLDAADEAHPVVKRRLNAAKPMDVRCCPDDVGRTLAAETLHLAQQAAGPATFLVFANTPATARSAFDRLRDRLAGEAAEILLVTGRSRQREAERTRRFLLDPDQGLFSSRAAGPRLRHLIVVATPVLEAGADLDAEYLVTEACGVRALTQRLGRLNRLGRFRHARAVYVHPDARECPVYGAEPAQVLHRLQQAGAGDEAPVNLSSRRIAGVLGSPEDDPGRAPEVLPALVWEWTKTATPPQGEAPVEPYFAGIAGTQYRVSLLWRVHVPGQGQYLWPRLDAGELVEVPLDEAREALEETEGLRRLGPDGVSVEVVFKEALKPSDVVVLPFDRGLLDEFGQWNRHARLPVADLSIARHGLPLSRTALWGLCGLSLPQKLIDPVAGIGPDHEALDEADRIEAADKILDLASLADPPPGWQDSRWQGFLARLKNRPPVAPPKEVPRVPLSVEPEPCSDELDELSLAEQAVRLDVHGLAVGERAGAIAERLGLPAGLARTVERAGRLHDLGKADRRFQRWLDPGAHHDTPQAKAPLPRHRWTAARAAAGWPRSGRHEALSARLVQQGLKQATQGDPVLEDLLLHLVVSHHGHGRPLVRPVPDETAGRVSGDVEHAHHAVSADLFHVDWEQPTRFKKLNDRFGPWGLALLETIVRQADHAVSAGTRTGRLEVR